MKAFLLDWSGTLVDDFTPTLAATNAVFTHYGKEPFTAEHLKEVFFLPYPDFYSQHLPGIPLTELEKVFREAFERAQKQVTLLPETLRFLDWAHHAGIRLLILTSMDPKNFAQQASEFGVDHYFEAVYSGVLDKRTKILEIITDHQLDCEETGYVGDMRHDIDAAKAGGLTSVAVLTGYDSAQRLAQRDPDFILPHIGMLTRLTAAAPRPRAGLPISTVGALIFDEQARFLLVKSHKWRGLWGIPGGKIEYGEASQEALRREILEETGLELSEIEFVCVQDSIASEEFYRPAHFLLLNYTAKAVNPSELALNEEAQDYRWVSLSEIDLYQLNKPTQRLVARFAS